MDLSLFCLSLRAAALCALFLSSSASSWVTCCSRSRVKAPSSSLRIAWRSFALTKLGKRTKILKYLYRLLYGIKCFFFCTTGKSQWCNKKSKTTFKFLFRSQASNHSLQNSRKNSKLKEKTQELGISLTPSCRNNGQKTSLT